MPEQFSAEAVRAEVVQLSGKVKAKLEGLRLEECSAQMLRSLLEQLVRIDQIVDAEMGAVEAEALMDTVIVDEPTVDAGDRSTLSGERDDSDDVCLKVDNAADKPATLMPSDEREGGDDCAHDEALMRIAESGRSKIMVQREEIAGIRAVRSGLEAQCDANERVSGRAVERAQYRSKAAANELMNQMLALDGLSFRCDRNKSLRKELIGHVQCLLDDADAEHEKLRCIVQSALDKGLLELASPKVPAAIPEAPAAESCTETVGAERHLAPESAPSPAPTLSRRRALSAQDLREFRQALLSTLQVKPAVETSEFENSYGVFVTASNVTLQHVRCDHGILAIHGTAEPSPQWLASYAQSLADSGCTNHEITSSVLSACAGRFGSFVVKLRVPSDADVQSAHEQTQNGTVTLVLPKKPLGYLYRHNIPW